MTDFEPGISAEAVEAKAGRDWEAWFEILDAEHAEAMKIFWAEALARLNGFLATRPSE